MTALLGGCAGPAAVVGCATRVCEVAARYGASAAAETADPDEATADWPGEYLPVRLPWPLDSGARP